MITKHGQTGPIDLTFFLNDRDSEQHRKPIKPKNENTDAVALRAVQVFN